MSNSKRYSRREAAAYLGMSIRWLDDRRYAGRTPAFYQNPATGSVYYEQEDLDAERARRTAGIRNEPRITEHQRPRRQVEA